MIKKKNISNGVKKVYILSAIALFAITLAGVTSAGFMKFSEKNPEKFNQMIERKAEMFGLNAEEVKAQLEGGESLGDIISETGLTKEEMFERKQKYMEDRINQMVTDGKITQKQADKKLEWMEEMHEKFSSGEFKGKGFHKGHKGGGHWIQK